MHIYTRLIPALCLAACAVSGDEAPSARLGQTMGADCNLDRECRQTGVIRIDFNSRVASSVLELPNGRCIPLALPVEVVSDFRDWDGETVQVSGLATSYAYSPDALWIDLGDRRLSTHLCDSTISIYVYEVFKLR